MNKCRLKNNKPNIFICPLDWGIGHATRCVPVINEFIIQGAKVTIGADNQPLAFLQKEFPNLDFIKFPGYRFKYPNNNRMAFSMMMSAPKIIQDIKKENRELEKLIAQEQFDAIISDNRYGLWSEKVHAVFMTHQINIQTPAYLSFLNYFLSHINRKYINHFDELWIPDVEDENNLSGKLSYGHHFENTYFIGPMTRFEESTNSEGEPQNDLLVMLSGPEPQRSILEEKIFDQLKVSNYRAVVLRGLPNSREEFNLTETVKVFSHVDSNTFQKLLQDSKLVICRPGYSSIMDLSVMGGNAVLIPTPGQTEQEYLAKLHTAKGHYFSMSQNKFDLKTAIENSASFTGIKISQNHGVLKTRVKSLLRTLKAK